LDHYRIISTGPEATARRMAGILGRNVYSTVMPILP
jgi:hypothetical protein